MQNVVVFLRPSDLHVPVDGISIERYIMLNEVGVDQFSDEEIKNQWYNFRFRLLDFHYNFPFILKHVIISRL